MQGMTNPQKVEFFYKNSSKEDMSLVTEFYDPNAEFTDPVGSIKGSENLKKYYSELYKNLKEINFDFPQIYQDKDTVIAIWVMTIKTDSLKGGEPVVVHGNSVITFNQNGQAIHHRDYFDLGEMVYEHIPVVGFFVRKIKAKLGEH